MVIPFNEMIVPCFGSAFGIRQQRQRQKAKFVDQFVKKIEIKIETKTKTKNEKPKLKTLLFRYNKYPAVLPRLLDVNGLKLIY